MEIEARPFLLRPDTPPEGSPGRGNAGSELQEPLATHAREAGLVMRRPTRISYTRLALEATEVAKEAGLFDPFHRAAYHAYWAEGRDLGDTRVLLELGAQVGVETEVLERALHDRSHEDTVLEQYEEAQKLGINGIPAFLIDRFLFTGARPYPMFQMVAKRALAEVES